MFQEISLQHAKFVITFYSTNFSFQTTGALKFSSSETWHHVVCWIGANVSEKHPASILQSEYGSGRFLCVFGTYLANYAASHSRRPMIQTLMVVRTYSWICPIYKWQSKHPQHYIAMNQYLSDYISSTATKCNRQCRTIYCPLSGSM